MALKEERFDGGSTGIAWRRRRLGILFRHLDFGHGKVGRPIFAPEEVDIPVATTLAPGIADLLKALDALGPQPSKVGGAEASLDLDHLAVDGAFVGENVIDLAVRLDRANAQAGRIQIGLAQEVA